MPPVRRLNSMSFGSARRSERHTAEMSISSGEAVVMDREPLKGDLMVAPN